MVNPVANGVPARILPPELLAASREGYELIPLTLLRQKPPENYILASGDTLGVFVEGILGNSESAPPVNLPATPEEPPSIGYPFPIREDGTVSLPYVGKVKVAGSTVEQAEQIVIDEYLKREILRPDDKRIIVTLLRPRTIRILVVRQDAPQRQVTLQNDSLLGLGTSRTTIGGGESATGQVLELPAYQNDILTVLARTGGMPGLESTQEVTIQRGYWNGSSELMGCPPIADSSLALANADPNSPQTIRIPLRTKGGVPPQIRPEDILLNPGDIVTVQARKPQFFYTGGLLPANEYPLPADYDLTVVEAVLKVRGPLNNGAINSNNLSGNVLGAGVGNPSPSLLSVLRQTPNGGQVNIRIDLNEALRDPRENILVAAGDILIMQEAVDEAWTRYWTNAVQLNFFSNFLDRGSAQGSASAVLP